MVKTTNFLTEKPRHRTMTHGFSVEDEQIDLIEILLILFRAKKIIILVVIIFCLAGLITGWLLPQKWTSTSVIIAPTENESAELGNLLNKLAVANIATGIDANYLLTTYMQFFDSRSLRDEFLQQSAYFKMLMKKDPNDETNKQNLLDVISTKNIVVSNNSADKPVDAKSYSYFRLNFSAQTPDAAKDLLQGYMNFVEKSVRQYIFFKIQHSLQLKINSEQEVFDLELQKAKNSRDVRINRLEYALSIANAADVKKPVYSDGGTIIDDPDYPITLGVDALKQKLNVEESITDPLMTNIDLRNRKLNIDFLSNIKITDINFKPYKYLQTPEKPSKKDQPKRLLILAIFTLLGLIVGIAIVLLRNVFAKRREITSFDEVSLK